MISISNNFAANLVKLHAIIAKHCANTLKKFYKIFNQFNLQIDVPIGNVLILQILRLEPISLSDLPNLYLNKNYSVAFS